MKKAIFPGSFDPFTKGHTNIVERSVTLFDEVIIGIGNNPQKKRYFPIEYMVEKIQSVFEDEPKVKVLVYEGLTADFARKLNAKYLIRGLRNTTDFEYENGICQANKYLWKDLETIFLITNPAYASISSTIIREIHRYNGDVTELLPYKL
jgi:pantetheine-phosphate adenylyltransferase